MAGWVISKHSTVKLYIKEYGNILAMSHPYDDFFYTQENSEQNLQEP